jgi:hypothetical protein
VMCLSWGCYTEANVVGLSGMCSRHIPAGEPVYRQGRFLQGRHPRKDLALDGPFEPLPAGESFEEDPSGWAALLGSLGRQGG